jgi:tRNA 2-thiouridine synthesizing protein A
MKTPDLVLDATGLICPLPLAKAKQQLSHLVAGQILQVICTDPSSIIDFKVFVELTLHKLLSYHQQDGKYYFYLEKGSC